ncbi:MAG TPA: phosphopantetheine-binding protein [Yinghuangia sp.]|uniref:acyl carrier protein n=1 Tax=Yinghuangia sp. YIM S10712 TaxID=3436930 RepID=UPI002C558067|nr:phosphopantetheine-binding protein [Yinghuangia sp.]
MSHDMQTFLADTFREWQISDGPITGGVLIGDGGLGIDSLLLTELETRFYTEFGVELESADVKRMPLMTVDELAALLADRAQGVT